MTSIYQIYLSGMFLLNLIVWFRQKEKHPTQWFISAIFEQNPYQSYGMVFKGFYKQPRYERYRTISIEEV